MEFFIRDNQLDIMLMIAGIVAVVIIFTIHLQFRNKKTKRSLIAMEISAFIMIVSDRAAYMYRGDESSLGYVMVRLTNFLVFFTILIELASFTRYVISVFESSAQIKKVPKALYWSQYIVLIGVILLIISQFTGLYYSFDSSNNYVRNKYFFICYIIPIIVFAILFFSVIKLFNKLNARLRVTLLIFPLVIFAGSFFQLFTYGISINTLCFCVMTLVLLVSALSDLNSTVKESHSRELGILQEQNKNVQELFTQTVEALAGAIDAKDKYTHGHSTRVAEYSVKLAKMAGKSDEECEEIYYAGILHDVGKIGIPDAIINKVGKLTDEEYEIIKSHPVMGGEILSRITKRPYLSIGAKYHHERYDGKGYPEHLKGDDIPEMARIIAVADAYDAMTSRRSYRDPIPQQKVREEIIKGIDTQFDPTYAKLMLKLIDTDLDYEMKEKDAIEQLDGKSEMVCNEYMEEISSGFLISKCRTSIKFNSTPLDKNDTENMPSIIIFDSLNGRAYKNETDAKAIDYFEYGEIHMDGTVNAPAVRNTRIRKIQRQDKLRKYQYCVEAVRFKDHLLAIVDNGKDRFEITFAMPDGSRYAYFAITGEHCTISDITIINAKEPITEDFIPRIAPKIIYLDLPDGDIPNVEINNYRSEHSEPILLKNTLNIEFTYRSLPTATRIWHCPMFVFFTSDDGTRNGNTYREYASIRFDGESWSENFENINTMSATKTSDFSGWDAWKTNSKKPLRTTVDISRDHENGSIILDTENLGVKIHNVTKLPDSPTNVYVLMTGDQCTYGNIKIKRN